MDPEVVSDVKDSIGMVLDKCMGTSNWEVSLLYDDDTLYGISC